MQKLERRPATTRRIIPHKVVKNVQAFCFWCRQQTNLGIQLDADEWTTDKMIAAKAEKEQHDSETTDVPNLKPDKFDPKEWVTWSQKFDV